MRTGSRRNLWWGLLIGLGLCVLGLAGLYLAGYRLMRHAAAPPAVPTQAERKPLCYVSPTDPDYIRFRPGEDDQGKDLVPVYPTKPGVPTTGRTVKYWVSPTDPTYIKTKPGKDPQGQDLVLFVGEMGQPGAAPAAEKKERKIKYWVSPMDPGYVRDKPGKAPCGMDLVPVYEEESPAAPKERKIKYWVAPMDPTYIRDQPGKSPMGMDLVPVYEEEPAAAVQEGTIAVDPRIVQSMGVRIAKAQVKDISRTIRAVGQVTYDERGLTVVTTKLPGWVERLYVKATGDPIRKGRKLLSLYSPQLVTTQEEYLLALKNLQTMQQSGIPEFQAGSRRLLAASRQRLEYWDIPDSQIERLKRTGAVQKTLTLVSPVNGVVIKRMVTEGQMVQAGMPLLEVADLSTVWVEADIYEYELPWVQVGQHATMTLTYLPGETFHGRVQYIYPYLQEATRTAKVRLAFRNPGLKLKPDMYAEVEIDSPLKQTTVVIPSEAVLNTGEKQHVFLTLGQGRFAPREIKVGVRGNDGMVQVLSGLQGGEEVVTSAQFLLDSESRFREAIAQMLKSGEEPETKPDTAPAPTPPPAPRAGHQH
ncbi:MAG: efflux RND transporter periplasmic adaptor subunit [Thermodesulfobacteriota bacterium]